MECYRSTLLIFMSSLCFIEPAALPGRNIDLGPMINPLDPTDLPSNMRYFPRISPKSLKISPEFWSNIQIQRPTYVYL